MVIGLVDMLLLQFSQSYYKIGLSDRYLTINYLQGVHSISSFISDLCQIDNFIQITFSRTLITSQDVVGMLNRVSMKYRIFYRKFNDVKSLVETYLFLTYRLLHQKRDNPKSWPFYDHFWPFFCQLH